MNEHIKFAVRRRKRQQAEELSVGTMAARGSKEDVQREHMRLREGE